MIGKTLESKDEEKEEKTTGITFSEACKDLSMEEIDKLLDYLIENNVTEITNDTVIKQKKIGAKTENN